MPELADVVIVGGGILGVTLALELTRRKMRVALLEAYALASGATGGGFAWLNATSKTDEFAYHQRNAASLQRYAQMEGSAEQKGLHGGGMLEWAAGIDGPGKLRLRQKAALLQNWGYPITLLQRGEIGTLEPGVAIGSEEMEGAEGLFAPADGWLDTPRFVRHCAGILRQSGADIREYTPAVQFVTGITGGINQVQTPGGNIATRQLVLAAGTQTPKLAASLSPLAETVIPLRRAPGVLVETPPGSAPHAIHRVLYPSDAGGLHLRPTPGGGLLIGADDLDARLNTESAEVVLSLAARELLPRIARHFPDLPCTALLESATSRLCLRPLPVDERPVVGALPGVSGVFVAVTHSGVTLAPELASLLAEEILVGRTPTLLAPYAPVRFLR